MTAIPPFVGLLAFVFFAVVSVWAAGLYDTARAGPFEREGEPPPPPVDLPPAPPKVQGGPFYRERIKCTQSVNYVTGLGESPIWEHRFQVDNEEWFLWVPMDVELADVRRAIEAIKDAS